MNQILNSKIINQALNELFFAFLAIFLIVLIYGLFHPDAGHSFFVPYWRKLEMILGATEVLGILAAIWGRR